MNLGFRITSVFVLLLLIGLAPVLVAQEDQEQTSTDSTTGLEFLRKGDVPSIEQLREMEQVIRDVSDQVKEATVNIQVNGAQGTGIIVSRDGYVLTAAHVIGKPNITARITFPDGSTARAKTLGVNRDVDSGMLKLIDEDRSFPYIDVGESETLNKGQWVLAVGHPGGWNEERGMVVRAGRVLSVTKKVVRTDCVLVGGDSGGPLVDMDGNLIGIHSRISSGVWENLHVPIDTFSEDWDELVDGEIIGGFQVPYVGINFKDTTNEISSVVGDGPADKAGLKEGDIIIEIDGTEISSKLDFGRMARRMKPKDKIKIKVKRDDEEMEFTLTVGQR